MTSLTSEVSTVGNGYSGAGGAHWLHHKWNIWAAGIVFLKFWLWSHEGIDLPWWLSGWRTCLKFRRHRRGGFDSWVKKVLWTRNWQAALVFLPGQSHRQRSLAGYSPRGCKESDMTEWLTFLPTRVYVCKVKSLAKKISVAFLYVCFWLHWVFLLGHAESSVWHVGWTLSWSMWNLSSLTRDWTQAPWIGKAES